MDKLVELMNDSFGNYLIQKVLEKLDENKLKGAEEEVKPAVKPKGKGDN